ncbi:hypothetical protein JTB14_007803 [Gonioctena quinquepunctata]|nr:hypothetical protein JTB14_007803 [Gonioctena quinquepunctata]
MSCDIQQLATPEKHFLEYSIFRICIFLFFSTVSALCDFQEAIECRENTEFCKEIMSARVKRMLMMATEKDQYTEDRLNQPMWETTKGSNLYDFNLSYLRKHFEKDSENGATVNENINPQDVEDSLFSKYSSSMVNEMTNASSSVGCGKTSNENYVNCNSNISNFDVTTRKINILSFEIIPPVDLPVQSPEPHRNICIFLIHKKFKFCFFIS